MKFTPDTLPASFAPVIEAMADAIGLVGPYGTDKQRAQEALCAALNAMQESGVAFQAGLAATTKYSTARIASDEWMKHVYDGSRYYSPSLIINLGDAP